MLYFVDKAQEALSVHVRHARGIKVLLPSKTKHEQFRTCVKFTPVAPSMDDKLEQQGHPPCTAVKKIVTK